MIDIDGVTKSHASKRASIKNVFIGFGSACGVTHCHLKLPSIATLADFGASSRHARPIPKYSSRLCRHDIDRVPLRLSFADIRKTSDSNGAK